MRGSAPRLRASSSALALHSAGVTSVGVPSAAKVSACALSSPVQPLGMKLAAYDTAPSVVSRGVAVAKAVEIWLSFSSSILAKARSSDWRIASGLLATK